jgi:BolA family transcriptional regulator, general stress-responsive regulator
VSSSERAALIRARLEEAFHPSDLAVIDESHKHRGHAGAARGGGHFNVTIVSNAFTGCPLLKRHRLIYEALSDLMKTEVHALSIKAWAPGEYPP